MLMLSDIRVILTEGVNSDLKNENVELLRSE